MNKSTEILECNEDYLRTLVKYFNVENASCITWAHAVNNKAYLQQCLANGTTAMMLEADVMVSQKTNTLIMAHPKLVLDQKQKYYDFNVESDLTFEEFVTSILKFNQTEKQKKGMKLDFKLPFVVKPCLKRLQELDQQGKLGETPIWLNADVLAGPGGRQPLFDAATFIKECTDLFPGGWLSLGYTISKDTAPGYTREMVDALIEYTKHCVGPVTVAVAVHFIQESWNEWCRLLQKANKYTLTLWCWKPVDTDLKAWLQSHMDPKRTFFDLVYES
jgi:hypothetical protein